LLRDSFLDAVPYLTNTPEARSVEIESDAVTDFCDHDGFSKLRETPDIAAPGLLVVNDISGSVMVRSAESTTETKTV
jgi:hypothetical protein